MNHQNLWAPWRIGYLKGLGTAPTDPAHEADGCFLCDAARPDLTDAERDERFVLLRDERGTLLLNRYPYTNGHLLAAPHDHLPDLADMTPDQRAGLMELAALGQRLLKATMNPQGLNLGMNVGRCAGAGLPGHVHLHIVPRWNGDVNFMDAIAGVRIIPQALAQSYHELKEALA
ncbi:MAG: HIT family protein, partial [Phycisphaeraceae bacterium]